MERIGERIKKLRTICDMTQDDWEKAVSEFIGL